jgi:signal transduction histidine kinase
MPVGRAVRRATFLAIFATLGAPLDWSRVQTGLVAVALTLVALLSESRAPSAAWLASIASSYVASTLRFGLSRAAVPGAVDLPEWVWLALLTSYWAISTAQIAAAYASRSGTRLDPIARPLAIGLVGWLVVGCLTTIVLILAGQRTPDPAFNWIDLATMPVGYFLVVIVTLCALGIIADIRSALERAAARLEPRPFEPKVERLWRLGSAMTADLIPGRTAALEAAEHDQRTRLAGDLHARVLPDLRRAISEAEAGGDPGALADRLRSIDLELDRLMADRWPVVLEAFGLVRALEDLAERLEADGSPPITIEIERSHAFADSAEREVDRQPQAVERAAWRFAQVTLDNAIRHAGAGAITIASSLARDRLRLVVADDGRGLPAEPAAPGPRGRGLADAARRAADVGAAVTVRPGPRGGVEAVFDWDPR